MSTLRGLDEACSTCDRPVGDHTLREWNVCMGTLTTDLPFEKTPPDMARAASEAVRAQFNLDDDLVIADHVVVKAVTLAGEVRGAAINVRLPALLHEFQIGLPGQPPGTLARVLFVGPADSVRGYGRLVRDSANGAVNAAERGT
jgi:hypothetical protein